MQFPKIPANAVVFDYGNTLMLSPFEAVLRLKKAEFQKELESIGSNSARRRLLMLG